MTNPQAGWYPDPSGDPAKLRYWDGTRWTDNFAPALQATANPANAAAQQAAAAGGAAAQQAAQPNAAVAAAYGAGSAAEAAGAQPLASTNYLGADGAIYGGTPTSGPSYGSAGTAQTVYQNVYVNSGTPDAPYDTFGTDKTLRMVAFILCIVSTVFCAILIIPLAWMIPMTVRAWGIYKGTKPNSTAFGVCTLLFLNLVGGILLLVSKKDI